MNYPKQLQDENPIVAHAFVLLLPFGIPHLFPLLPSRYHPLGIHGFLATNSGGSEANSCSILRMDPAGYGGHPIP